MILNKLSYTIIIVAIIVSGCKVDSKDIPKDMKAHEKLKLIFKENEYSFERLQKLGNYHELKLDKKFQEESLWFKTDCFVSQSIIEINNSDSANNFMLTVKKHETDYWDYEVMLLSDSEDKSFKLKDGAKESISIPEGTSFIVIKDPMAGEMSRHFKITLRK